MAPPMSRMAPAMSHVVDVYVYVYVYVCVYIYIYIYTYSPQVSSIQSKRAKAAESTSRSGNKGSRAKLRL